jgi:predicted acylesterase/phospholipase RssA
MRFRQKQLCCSEQQFVIGLSQSGHFLRMRRRKHIVSLAIVGSSGGMKGVFVQGVLNAFETGGLRADAYAGASASALPAVSAAAKLCNFVGYHYWQKVQQLLQQPGQDLGSVMRNVTHQWNSDDEPFKRELFQAGRPRLFVPANFVKSKSAAELTQSEKSRRLGRQLLIDIGHKDRTWVDENLELRLFDTQSEPQKLTADNLHDIAYASTRMIQWSTPAWIDGKPYVDASYNCACPAVEMVALGYAEVIAISTEIGAVYRDIFADKIIPEKYNDIPIHIIRPEYDLKEIGVDFTSCTAEGLIAAFRHGEAQGRAFLQK